ncbi:hypothetical protein DRJ04_07845 [Candidatus Aerophobetes bacterium]|uniref:Uncharacterized protein n=1 Tax=Aerophobetes bacterium TaxID=2030807 RepID=A0A662DBQ5_UNCAE|nr:MAG: hypothetical protein DRJ04_07845 [Candidatus Aerophobetes bacterium]
MAWVILFLAILLSLTDEPQQNSEHYFEKHYIENITVVFMDHETLNVWWRLVGGQKQWEKVHAFTYYDPGKNMYYIVLPPNADHKLIGYEFNHILEWKRDQNSTPPTTPTDYR